MKLTMSSKLVRSEFIKFFIDNHHHTFVRSSPVVPYCDFTVPFVNAGMYQFKGIFLGHTKPPCSRAVNSQKCIRVGGKHNDLESVGLDGYHHTFFEMLGNWSFGDYFKEKACRMAWELLTGPYALNPERLYVTYFGGDKRLNLEPDMETKDLWDCIGVPHNHIVASGIADNFWEMGPCGPCGPCTEIHYDHIPDRQNAAHRVNQGGDDLVELWNIVFIQYNRELDGSLTKLPFFHVDTGMGLERLVAVLQGKRSNYDTDFFLPLFKAIQKKTGSPSYNGLNGKLDTEYRILADHVRMVTVAIADGMFPDQSPKLRRVLRRALGSAKHAFHAEKGLMGELTNYVAESFADAYPEIGARLKQVQLVINHEEEVLRALRKTSSLQWEEMVKTDGSLSALDIQMMPGIVGAFKELQEYKNIPTRPQTITPDLAFKLYDTFGLDQEAMQVLCSHHGLLVDFYSFQDILQDTRVKSRENNILTKSETVVNRELIESYGTIKESDDSFKYKYRKESHYVFPSLESMVQVVICGKKLVQEAIPGEQCGVILNRTNFYHEAGGQDGDIGQMILKDGTSLKVNGVYNIDGYIVHQVTIPKECRLAAGDTVLLEISPSHRSGNMRNHTATHLLNAALHRTLTATCQKSSHVSDSSLTFDFAVYGENFTSEVVERVEHLVRSAIKSNVPVQRRTITSNELQNLYVANDITLVPGEVYPQEDIYLIEMEADGILKSREACCGTHVLHTGDVGEFCITGMRAPAASTRTVWAVTGPDAEQAILAGRQMAVRVNNLVDTVQHALKNPEISPEQCSKYAQSPAWRMPCPLAGTDGYGICPKENLFKMLKILNREKYIEDHFYDGQNIGSLEAKLKNLKQEISITSKFYMPYVVRSNSLQALEEVSRILKLGARNVNRQSLETEIRELLEKLRDSETDYKYIVHYLQCTADNVPLQKATKLCPHLPILLLARSDGLVKARCCVPKELVTQAFNAKLWMEPVIRVFNAQGFVPRGQDDKEVFNMKGKSVKENELSSLVQEAVNSASKYAESAMSSKFKHLQNCAE